MSGRHSAKHVVFTFVAISLRRYDFVLAFSQQFPRYKENKTSTGIIIGHDDVILEAYAKAMSRSWSCALSIFLLRFGMFCCHTM